MATTSLFCMYLEGVPRHPEILLSGYYRFLSRPL
jgi:hypothetical protein